MPMPVSARVRVLASSSRVRSMRGLKVDEGEVTELVEGVRGVADELAEEDLGVRVEGVDDELKELGDFGLELLFRHRTLF
jgi:hypothetical protein